MNRFVITGCVLCLFALPIRADDPVNDQDLLSQAAATRAPAKPQAPAPARSTAVMASPVKAQPPAPDADEVRAQGELILAQAKVDLLAARKSLRDKRAQQAADRARAVLENLKNLPADMDAGELELQAEGVVAKAQKLGAAVDAPVLAGQPSSAAADDARAPLDQQARNAVRIARSYEGSDHPDIASDADVKELRERALRNQNADRWGYRPAREIVDRENAQDRARQDAAYQPELQQVYSADEQHRLTAVDEARVAGDSPVIYPRDWAAKTAARAKYKDRPLARSDAHNDKDGHQWSAAVYDIADLTEIPPDFHPAYSLDIYENQINAADRQALRDRSQIFSGTAADLAAGIPLLDYFGGNGNLDARSRYSSMRQSQIVEMIKAFEATDTEPRVIMLPPVR